MVAQHSVPSPTSSDQTLQAVWRDAGQRLTPRRAAGVLLVGVAAVAATVVTKRLFMVGSLGLLAIAFACYSATEHGDVAGLRVAAGVRRFLGAIASLIAVLAAVATGLLILAALFGGSIEVMRR